MNNIKYCPHCFWPLIHTPNTNLYYCKQCKSKWLIAEIEEVIP